MIGKILIVDDVSTNRIVFKVKLTAAGYQTLMASDGESCVRLAVAEVPDIILLDLFLPDRSGIEVLKSLKAHPLTRRIPVVMFSSEADGAMRLAALRAGAEDFMARPIDDQTLLARLRGLLRAREHLAGIEAPERDLQYPCHERKRIANNGNPGKEQRPNTIAGKPGLWQNFSKNSD